MEKKTTNGRKKPSKKTKSSFPDTQSILHAGSVRRKDTEALKIVERKK